MSDGDDGEETRAEDPVGRESRDTDCDVDGVASERGWDVEGVAEEESSKRGCDVDGVAGEESIEVAGSDRSTEPLVDSAASEVELEESSVASLAEMFLLCNTFKSLR